VLTIAAAAILILSAQRAQTDGRVSSSFDVVSIRPADDSSPPAVDITADSYERRNFPLAIVILDAYYPYAYQRRDGLEGAPDWIWEDHYTFVGKVGAEQIASWKKAQDNSSSITGNPVLQSMLRAALSERCGLAVHIVPGTIDGYALVVSRGGPNLKRLTKTTPGESLPSSAQQIAMPELIDQI
jgi:uncharacterized protein (TIGR03435 family)